MLKPMFSMNAMYQMILDGLFAANGCETEAEQAAYLSGLKPATQSLWRSYRANHSIHENANYESAETQAGYMLRYFPHYTQLLPEVLERLPMAKLGSILKRELHVSLFGPGPAPELVGLVQFLEMYWGQDCRLIADLFDIKSTAWEKCRNITVDRLLPAISSRTTVEANAHECDFTEKGVVDSIAAGSRNPLALADLVVFQNCFNEVLDARRDTFIANLKNIQASMKQGALLVLIDRIPNYSMSEGIFSELLEACSNGNGFEVVVDDANCRRCNKGDLAQMPAIIRANLMTGEDQLISGGSVNYRCLMLCKI